jgi:hypothetical protein
MRAYLVNRRGAWLAEEYPWISVGVCLLCLLWLALLGTASGRWMLHEFRAMGLPMQALVALVSFAGFLMITALVSALVSLAVARLRKG